MPWATNSDKLLYLRETTRKSTRFPRMQQKHLKFSSGLIILKLNFALIYLPFASFLSCKCYGYSFTIVNSIDVTVSKLHRCIKVTLLPFLHSVCEIPYWKNPVWYITWNFDQEIRGAFEELRRWRCGSEPSCRSLGGSKAKNLWHYQCPRGCWLNQKKIKKQHWMEVSDLEQIYCCHTFTHTSFI